jgi:hypothetical protein
VLQKNLQSLFKDNGFKILKIVSLHSVYTQDNLRMKKKFKNEKKHLLQHTPLADIAAIEELLEWETALFTNGWWTGELVVARKGTKA